MPRNVYLILAQYSSLRHTCRSLTPCHKYSRSAAPTILVFLYTYKRLRHTKCKLYVLFNKRLSWFFVASNTDRWNFRFTPARLCAPFYLRNIRVRSTTLPEFFYLNLSSLRRYSPFYSSANFANPGGAAVLASHLPWPCIAFRCVKQKHTHRLAFSCLEHCLCACSGCAQVRLQCPVKVKENRCVVARVLYWLCCVLFQPKRTADGYVSHPWHCVCSPVKTSDNRQIVCRLIYIGIYVHAHIYTTARVYIRIYLYSHVEFNGSLLFIRLLLTCSAACAPKGRLGAVHWGEKLSILFLLSHFSLLPIWCYRQWRPLMFQVKPCRCKSMMTSRSLRERWPALESWRDV